jgi:NADPH-dependent 2,4-dienoyl-CoA reductase/sulfur reductase-like enzyme
MRVVIIGNGIAGSTAARYLRKYSDSEIIMISEESKFPFSRTALMYIYMGHLTFDHTKLYEDDFWQRNRIQLVQSKVTHVDKENKTITLGNEETLQYDYLILATGSQPNKFGWPGQDLEGVQTLYFLQDLKKLEEYTHSGIKRAVIVGGGLIGVELAEMLKSRHFEVTMLVRESSFWNIVLPQEEADMISDHIRLHGVDLRLNAELKSINGTDNKVQSLTTGTDQEIKCDLVGITVGVSPNVVLAKEIGLEVNRGIKVSENLMTSNPYIFAIGDCAELITPKEGRRGVEAVWYVGREMGQVAAANITGHKIDYDQKIWFNSAKFFDVEYQVYGFVPNIIADPYDTLYYRSPEEYKSIRIVYHKETLTVVGFNLMGVRYRHEVCNAWLEKKSSLSDVIKGLKAANFDPEFFDMIEDQMVILYEQKFGKLQNTTVGITRGLNAARSLVHKILG